MEIKKSYYGIIPADVRYSKEIPPGAKLLFSEFTALCNEKGYCWASNTYFSELYETSNVTISKWIRALEQAGFIRLEYDKRGFQVTERRIFIPSVKETFNGSVKEKLIRSDKEIFKDNNTINITNDKKDLSLEFSKEVVGLVDGLLSLMKQNDPQVREPKLDKWYSDMRKIVELDKRDPIEIWRIIKFSQADDFWKSNILSPKKLRDKYTTLKLQSERKGNGSHRKTSPTIDDAVATFEQTKRLIEADRR